MFDTEEKMNYTDDRENNGGCIMEFAKDFPIWGKLTKEEQERLRDVSVLRRIKARL